MKRAIHHLAFAAGLCAFAPSVAAEGFDVLGRIDIHRSQIIVAAR